MDDLLCVELWLTVICLNLGIYWYGSVPWFVADRCWGCHNERQASAAANAPNLHGRFVDAGTALLG